MSFIRFMNSRKTILDRVNYLIDKYEKELLNEIGYSMSCKDDLMSRITKELDSYRNDYSKTPYSNEELMKQALNYVCLNSFELFEGHKYRVMGVVNWVGPAKYASGVHKKAIKEAVDLGYITQEDADEDALALRDVIRMRL